MDRQFFSQGFHVAFGQNTQSSISTNRKIRSSTPCLFAAREKRKGSSFLTVSKGKNPPLFKFNSSRVGFENVGNSICIMVTREKICISKYKSSQV